MLNIFIPQETLEDIVIDNMASDMKPEDQDVWFKIFTKQEFIYVSSLDEKKYLTQEDPLFILDSSGVAIRYATNYIEDIPLNHQSVTDYWNGIFLLDIPEDEAADIQRNYGVICQSINNLDASVLIDPALNFSLEESDERHSWYTILDRINANHIPSNHLILIDRYIFAHADELETALDNIFYIMDAMLPHHQLKCPYKVTIFFGEQAEGIGIGLSQAAAEVSKMVTDLERPYTIHVEVIYLSHHSKLYKPSHNRKILTNYTITQLEYKLNAFDENGRSSCMQTIHPQGLFSPNGLNGHCDSPHKTHNDIMEAIYKNLFGWVNHKPAYNCSYAFDGKTMNINMIYGIKKIGKNLSLFEKNCK